MNSSTLRQQAEQVIVEHQSKLKAFIRKRVANNEDVEDILQDVFYQFVKTLENSMDPIQQVSAWLYRVARNMIINKGIKKREERLPTYHNDNADDDEMKEISDFLFSTSPSASPDMEYLRSLVWAELEDALAELPSEQREIFELTELDDMPVKEIAQATGVSVNTLLSRKHYAIKHLRQRLAGLYKDIIYT